MGIPILLFFVGLVLLIKGGDWFVDAATGIAHRFHVPELLIGATVVSIGTTLPEVMVSAQSALSGHGEIAYGNAIGSVICNAALIAAITITVRPANADRKAMRLPLCFFLVAGAIYTGVAYAGGTYSRALGFVLLALFAAYMVLTVLQMKRTPATLPLPAEGAEQPAEEKPAKPLWWDLLWLVVGAACIAFGANLLVNNGTKIAQGMGVPESVIALTFVALGTSLPELVTAITSLVKGHGALSLGNILGANLFNLVLVSGISIAIAPFDRPGNALPNGMNMSLVIDLPVMWAAMLLLCVPTLLTGKLHRYQGIAMLILYAGFCAVQFAL